MTYIPRTISPHILRAAEYFPVIVVTGPRQSGKSTLCRNLFPSYNHYNLEDVALREKILEDPKYFLNSCGEKVIIDEVQRAPDLLSYIQIIVDENESRKFILTGSSNFALMESITQSLAGRASLFTLLPFSFTEIGKKLEDSTDLLMLQGFYPSVITGKRPYDLFYPSYYSTYIERDVRKLINVRNFTLFQTFIKLAAGRAGSEFNASQLSVEVGVSSPTIKSWMSILQASYIIFLLPPYHANLNKRLTKTPKIYFYDTGLLCYLLGIKTYDQIAVHPLRGSIFENLAVAEMMKAGYNEARQPGLYFYRENAGREVDIVRATGNVIQDTDTNHFVEQLDLYEIKSSSTYNKSYEKNLRYFRQLLPAQIRDTTILYDGDPIPPTILNIRSLP